MEIRHLRYFVAVAETLSFTVAARQLGMAQPPLSVQIKRLEEEIGARLFDRSNRKTTLTPAGRHLLKRAREIIQLSEQARTEIEDATAGRTGTLEIGVTPLAFSSEPTRLLRKFIRRHRGIRVRITKGEAASLLARLISGEIDAAYGIADESWTPSKVVVCTSRLGMALGKKHRLQDRQRISLSDLAGERIFVGAAENTDPAGKAFTLLTRHSSLSFDIDRTLGSVEERLWQAAIGLGIAPALALEAEFLASSLRFLPLEEKDAAFPIFCYASPASHSPALAPLLEFITAAEKAAS